MGFRDENEALRARIVRLESEKAQLLEEKQRLENPKAAAAKAPDPVLERMAKRGTDEQNKEQRAQRVRDAERAKAADRLRRGKARVHVESTPESTIIHIAAPALIHPLREHFTWGFLFLFANPGWLVVSGLGFFFSALCDLGVYASLTAACVTWTAALTLMNVTYAIWTNPACRLEFTPERYALYKRGKDPAVFGERRKLGLGANDSDPTKLHDVGISDGRKEERIRYLRADDLDALRDATALPES